MTGDPRIDPGTAPIEASVRPVVAPPSGGASTLLIGSGVVVAAIALFLVLDARRQTAEAPAVRVSAADRAAAAGPAPPPPLAVPPPPLPPEPVVETIPVAPSYTPPAAPRIVYVPQPAAPAPAYFPPPSPAPKRGGDDSALVIDTTAADGSTPATPEGTAGAGGNTATTGAGNGAATTAPFAARARAIVLADRSTTVPQGTLIPAVLETAFDSTRPGLARALVSRDVRGFDGSRILIPRGSRLTGDYRSDAASGQNRALIIWTRLVRPDGAAIAIASPAADPLGRGGVKAHVNTHFLARFTGAILQTALAVGVNLASRPTTGTVVLGLPGSTIGAPTLFNQNQQVTNTLTVRAGTSIDVFVSRDLDFADVEGRR